jgi:hypothetical protein
MLLAAFLLFTVFYLLPGLFLHFRLRERGITLPISLGLGLAILIVIDVWLACLFGYRFLLQLGANIFIIGALARWSQPGWSSGWQWLRAQWPWPLAGWLAVAAIFLVPAFVIPFPFDTDAQGFGYLTLTVRLSGMINSLAPFWPDIKYLYSPGFMLLAAQLADGLPGATTEVALAALGHALAVLVVGGVYAVGREFDDERVGGWAAVFCIIGYALFSSLMDSAYTTVLGLALTTSILVLVLRAARDPNRDNILLAAIALASLPLSHPDSILHLLMAYVPFYFTIWLARERPTRKQYLALTVLIPGIGIALCLPWIIQMLPLVGGVHVHERLYPMWQHLSYIFSLNGWMVPVLAIGGFGLALTRRRWFDLWLIGWVIMIIELSSTGLLDSLSRRLAFDPMQIVYPFGVAWHATIIPLPILAAMAVCAVWPLRQWQPPRRWQTSLSLFVILGALAAGLFSNPIIQLSKGRVALVGSLSSEADRKAMLWIRSNTPTDSFILNYPGIEGDWASVLTERKTVQFREQLFYIGAGPAWALQEELRAAFLNPADSKSGDVIRAAGVDYVLVPQVIGRPESLAEAMRWRPPFVEPRQSSFADADYLELIQDFNGAQIWKVK